MRLVAQHQHPQRMRARDRIARPVQAAVIIRSNHQLRPRVRMRLKRLQIAFLRRIGQAVRRIGGPGEYRLKPRRGAQVQRAYMHIARQNHLFPAAGRIQKHRMNSRRGAAVQQNGVHRARAARRQLLRAAIAPSGAYKSSVTGSSVVSSR